MGSPMTSEVMAIQIAKEQPNFIKTALIDRVISRALTYLKAGYPVHLTGPAGTGKTTLAMYIASQLGRPVILLHGDEELGTSHLVGGDYGLRRKKMVDNFIHSVLKTEEDVSPRWVDSRLTVACREGFTLAYDEFTRSRPETNNILLAVLEEKILDISSAQGENSYIRVHPDFSAIFTSNPEEYAGVHAAQDALKDRMVTIKLGHFDRETEIAITQVKSGIGKPQAEKIVDLIRDFRASGNGRSSSCSVRACIMIAKVWQMNNAGMSLNNPDFMDYVLDVLGSHIDNQDQAIAEEIIKQLAKKVA